MVYPGVPVDYPESRDDTCDAGRLRRPARTGLPQDRRPTNDEGNLRLFRRPSTFVKNANSTIMPSEVQKSIKIS